MTGDLLHPSIFARWRPELQSLLDDLHQRSIQQERDANSVGSFFPRSNSNDAGTATAPGEAFFKDKMVALDQDKASYIYLMLRSIGATRIFEAGTSYGVSTLYLVAALRDNIAQSHDSASTSTHTPCVFGTEHEPEKAKIAYEHMRKGFSQDGEAADIEKKKQLRILPGDLLKSIPEQSFAKDSLDALLLDIWAPLALPTLKSLETALRPGALLFVDNTISGRDRYKDLLQYINDSNSEWQSQTLPFSGGLEMAVKLGK